MAERKLDQQSLAVAAVYSDALIALAAESGQEAALLEELEALVGLLDTVPEFEEFLSSPLIEPEAQQAVLETALRGKASDLLVDGLQIVRSKGRLGILRAIAASYRAHWLRRQGRVEVRVATAVPLTAELRAALAAAAQRATGKIADLQESVNPSLLGGMVVRIGDQKLDRSVAAGVERLGAALMERAAAELLSDKSYLTEEAGA